MPVRDRIVIVGVPTSGKTTLSLQLADRLATRVFHLDQVADAGGDPDSGELHAPIGELPVGVFEPRPLEHRREIVDGIAANSRWIAEGAFLDWTDPLLDRADTIIWLDHLSPVAVSRRILGRVKRSSGRESTKRLHGSRWRRPTAIIRHGFELIRELWDVTGYFWRRKPVRVVDDIAARRWDRISRSAVRTALAPHHAKVIHVRDPETFDSIEQLLGLRSTAQPAIDA